MGGKVIGLAWPALNIWLLKNPEDSLSWIFEFAFFLSSSFSPYHSAGPSIQLIYLKLTSCPKQHIAQFVSCSLSKSFFLPEAPVQRNVFIEQNITQAAFGAVLCHDGNIWHFYTTSNEFAEIGMVKFPVKINKNDSIPAIFMDVPPAFCRVTGKPSALSHHIGRKVKRA